MPTIFPYEPERQAFISTLTGRAEHIIPLTRTQLAAKIVDLNEDKVILESRLGMIWSFLKAQILDSDCDGLLDYIENYGWIMLAMEFNEAWNDWVECDRELGYCIFDVGFRIGLI